MYKESGNLVNAWYAAGQSKSFGNKKPHKVKIFGISIVCWRKVDGTVTAILNRCNHRNVPLGEGKIKMDCIICPYHGWVYDGAGQCVNIPSEGPHLERIPKKRVEKFPVLEENGLVWIWMGRDRGPEGKPFPMPLLKDKNWSSYYMETHFDNNVTDLVENFMDVPHTIFVHKGWFRERKQIRIEALVERTKDSVLVTYEQSNDAIGFSNRLINPKNLPMKHTDNFYMPNNTRVDYIFGQEERGFIIASTCTPISAFSTMVYTLITYKFGWMTALAKLGLKAYTKKVINQDVWIMKLHGENIKEFGQSDYRSTQSDTMHLFIEHLRNAAEEKKESPRPLATNIEFWV